MAVTWSTQLLANESCVEYSLSNDKLNLIENATMSKFIDSGPAHRVLYMYRAILKNLIMNTTYGKLKILMFVEEVLDESFSLSCGKSRWLEYEIFVSNNTK